MKEMSKGHTPVRCDDCTKDVTKEIQIYPKEGGVLCSECNWKIGESEKNRNVPK